jgi:hypothetical protein
VTELRRAIPFLLVPLLLFVAGCALLPWELPGVGASEKPVPGGPAGAALEANRATWAAAGIDDYTLELRFLCFCPARDPVTVTVEDGLVTDVRTPDGQPADEWFRSFPLTVEALHEDVARTLERGGTVEAEYGEHGVPLRLSLDPIPEAVDDELTIEVRSFSLGT